MRTGELVKTQELEYAEDGKALKGFLAWDDGRTARRPGVLVFHENTGLTDHEKGRASRLADLGYVALACDLFGERTIPADDSKRREAFEEFRKNKLIPRARAGLDALCKHPCVDLTRVAAIGFCLGGMTALELARSGADLKAVVSFHGGLATATAAPAGRMKAKVLVCHGASDPYVKMDQVIAFA